MKSQRPYLLRALYQWVVDGDEVPYVLVDASIAGVQVPQQHVEDGQIVLNLGPNAVRDLVLGDEFVMCSSRFDGLTFDLVLPIESVKAIYCKDTGAGMVFPEELAAAQGPSDVEQKPSPVEAVPSADPDPNKPTLRLV